MKIFFCLFCLFVGMDFYADESAKPVPEVKNYQFNQLSILQGLLDNEIAEVIQDESGFIWMASSQGLIRYNGIGYDNFHHNVNNPTSLTHNEINAIFEDNKGRLWIGTERGLNVRLKHQEAFIRYLNSADQAESLADNHIVDITQNENGRVWIASSTAVHLFNENSESFTRHFFYDPVSGKNTNITQLLSVADELYVVTSYGLYHYLNDEKRFELYGLINGMPAESYQITAISYDSDNTILLAISGHGLYQGYLNTHNFTAFEEINSQLFGITDITAIKSGETTNELWLGTRAQGLYSVDLESQNIIKIQQSNVNDFYAFENSQINGIFKDQSGLMWVYTEQGGVFLWSDHTLGIEHYGFHGGFRDEKLLRSYVWFFYQTNDNQIWVGTEKGLMLFDRSTGQYLSVMTDDRPYEEQPSVYWITEDGNTLWLATSEGLIHYDYRADKIINRYLEGLENSLYSVHIDAANLYVAIDEQGIIMLDRQDLTTKDSSITKGGSQADLVSRPVGIKADEDGSLWILTREGLVNYDPDADTIRLALTAGVEQLSGARVSAFYQRENHYWIGTTGNGLNLLVVNDFATADFEVTQFDDNPELANLVVNGVLVDDLDEYKVWISTHGGLIQFDPKTQYSRKLKLSEGLQSIEFNEAAQFKDSSGNLYFGGINGFNLIKPEQISQSDFQAPVRITDIRLSCATPSTECIDAESRFREYIKCDSLSDDCAEMSRNLPSDIQTISIEFASLDYTLPENNIYRYRLKQSNEPKWSDLGHTNRLTLSGLSSGSYVLEIQGTNFAGEWSPIYGELSFNVDQPWYYENYTLVILLLTIITAIYFFLEIRKLRQRERQRIEHAIRTNEENFKFALWGSGDEIWDWNILEDQISRTNPIQQIAFNDDSNSLSMPDAMNKIHPEDSSRVRREMRDIISGKQPFMESIFRFKSKGEGYLWVMCRARVVNRNENQHAVRALGSLKDITLMKATEDKLTLIAQAFENTKEGISVVNKDFVPIFSNKAFYDITGLDQLESINKQYFFAPESENHSLLNQVKAYLNNFNEWEGEIWEKRDAGDEFAMSLKIDNVHDASNNEEYFICVFSDITYKKRSEEELIRLANIDALTGLPNRSLFLDRLSHAIAYSRRNKTLFALLFIDLDNFKNINDTLGHSIGDKMLINISKRLKSCVRDVDTVARLGGDEFTVILENINTTNEVGVCANKILNRLSESMEIDGSLLKTTPSIGIGMYPAHGSDREILLKNADLAMYSAKEKGKNNYQFFTEDMTSLAMERINIENKLREAIESDQLTLFYQPKLYSVTGEVTGFEALIRWMHPEDGMISPGAFIPVAEETGLILSLGDWIIEQAIKQAKEWSEIAPDHCQIAVNISAKQFMTDTFPDRIAELLDKYDLHPKYIELEITEGTLMENMHHTINALKKLRDMGIEISLDDFGTGYSSLSYLKQFPVNQLKIDQSFVRDVTTDPSDASIVASIITLAHNLSLTVVAEGCETIEQLDFLRAYHCEQVQGYLFSRPLPAEEAEKILRAGSIIVDEK